MSRPQPTTLARGPQPTDVQSGQYTSARYPQGQRLQNEQLTRWQEPRGLAGGLQSAVDGLAERSAGGQQASGMSGLLPAGSNR